MKSDQIYFFLRRFSVSRIPAFCAVLIAGTANLNAQDLAWQDRGDRHEGVIARENISGGYFKLLGVRVEEGEQLQKTAVNLQISFWLPSPQVLNIRVYEPHSNYWMVPHAKKFSAQMQSFAWPLAPVIRALNLELQQLQVLVADENETLYFPARLFTSAPPASADWRYLFSFDSKGSVELAGTITRESGKQLVPVKKFTLTEEYPGRVRIVWDGKDSAGQETPSGVCRLQLQGSIYLSDSEETLTVDVRFMHRGKVER